MADTGPLPSLGYRPSLDEDLVSIIVPTFKEALNLPHLIPAISGVMRKARIDFEIIIVDDDSQDGSEERVKLFQQAHPVRMVVRKNARGLSSAVLDGFRLAEGNFLVCMDADLSHPPDKIPALIEQLRDPEVDFVIGSRYCRGGSTEAAWGIARRLNSRVATMLARPFTNAADPLAGFFALRRATFTKAGPLSPIGYKIGLELIVKARCQNVREVPIHFTNRKFGQTKLSLREQANYLRHLKRLLDFKYGLLSRLFQFCLVGTSGAIVDLVVFNLLLLTLDVSLSRAVAILTAMTSNFWLNRRLTFSYSRRMSWTGAYIRFVLSCLVGGVVNWIVSVGLLTSSSFWRDQATLAALLGILSGTAFNFVLSRHWVFAVNRPS
jgi:dolichol-phosphate mannosyltransferase